MRFGLFDQPGHRPMLAMGNELSKYSFWDLQRLQEGYDPGDEIVKPAKKKRGRVPGEIALGVAGANQGREESTASNASSSECLCIVSTARAAWLILIALAKASQFSEPISAAPEVRSYIADPYKPLTAHKSIVIPGNLNFACRQVAWSNCGKWCVAVGDYSMIVVFKRWA